MEEEIDLRELLAIIWGGKYIMISIALVAMLIAAFYSLFFYYPFRA